jgi:hypothetical protein
MTWHAKDSPNKNSQTSRRTPRDTQTNQIAPAKIIAGAAPPKVFASIADWTAKTELETAEASTNSAPK